jgi:hypothetical protein
MEHCLAYWRRKNLSFSLFNANGKSMVSDLKLNQDAYYEFKNIRMDFNPHVNPWPANMAGQINPDRILTVRESHFITYW